MCTGITIKKDIPTNLVPQRLRSYLSFAVHEKINNILTDMIYNKNLLLIGY